MVLVTSAKIVRRVTLKHTTGNKPVGTFNIYARVQANGGGANRLVKLLPILNSLTLTVKCAIIIK